MADSSSLKRGTSEISPLSAEPSKRKPKVLDMSQEAAPTSAAASSAVQMLNKNDVELTVHTRVNQALSNMQNPNVQMPPSESQNSPVDTQAEITKQVINHIIPVVISSVVSAVQEVLSKFLTQVEKTYSSQSELQCQAEIRRLTYQNDQYEQYSRRESLRVHGLAEDINESKEQTEEKVLRVFNEIGANVSAQDISDCHRVGKPKDGKKAIIVKFLSRKPRHLVMTKKANLKGKTGYERVFINEDLTRLRQRLLGYTKSLPNIESAWTAGGTIIAKKRSPPGLTADKVPRPIRITSPDDLFLLGIDKVDYERLGLSGIAFGEGHKGTSHRP